MPRPRLNPARATKAIAPDQKRSARQPRKSQPAGRVPLGSLRARKAQSAASPLPDFIPFATCLLVNRPCNEPDWVHKVKPHGWRVQVRVEEGTTTIRAQRPRLHQRIPRNRQNRTRARELHHRCEICAVDKDGLTDLDSDASVIKLPLLYTAQRVTPVGTSATIAAASYRRPHAAIHYRCNQRADGLRGVATLPANLIGKGAVDDEPSYYVLEYKEAIASGISAMTARSLRSSVAKS